MELTSSKAKKIAMMFDVGGWSDPVIFGSIDSIKNSILSDIK
jgi:hypothetical protein